MLSQSSKHDFLKYEYKSDRSSQSWRRSSAVHTCGTQSQVQNVQGTSTCTKYRAVFQCLQPWKVGQGQEHPNVDGRLRTDHPSHLEPQFISLLPSRLVPAITLCCLLVLFAPSLSLHRMPTTKHHPLFDLSPTASLRLNSSRDTTRGARVLCSTRARHLPNACPQLTRKLRERDP